MIQSNDKKNRILKDAAAPKAYHAPKLTLLGPIHGIVQNAGGSGGDGAPGAADSLS